MTSARRWAVRGGVGALLAGTIAIGGLAAADAASGSGSSRAPATLAQTNWTASSPSSANRSGAASTWAPGGAWRHGPSAGGLGFDGGGTITAIGAGSVTVKSRFATITVLTTSQTLYVEAMSTVPRSDLKVGQRVAVTVKLQAPPAGSFPNWKPANLPPAGSSGSGPSATTSAVTTARPTAAAIDIVLPQLTGRVVSVSSDKIVVEGSSGLQQTLVTAGTTSYRELGSTVSVSAVTTGGVVVGFGSVAGDHTELDATTVAVVGPLAGGKVTGVSGSTITVQSPRGTVRISTSSSTIFRTNAGSSSLASVKSGDLVLAVGEQAGTSGFTASGLWFGTTSGPSDALRIASGLGQAALGGPGGFAAPLFGHGFGGDGFGGHGFGGFRGPSSGHSGSSPGSPPSGATTGPGSGTTTS
jgi:hypothetical protein